MEYAHKDNGKIPLQNDFCLMNNDIVFILWPDENNLAGK